MSKKCRYNYIKIYINKNNKHVIKLFNTYTFNAISKYHFLWSFYVKIFNKNLLYI